MLFPLTSLRHTQINTTFFVSLCDLDCIVSLFLLGPPLLLLLLDQPLSELVEVGGDLGGDLVEVVDAVVSL